MEETHHHCSERVVIGTVGEVHLPEGEFGGEGLAKGHRACGEASISESTTTARAMDRLSGLSLLHRSCKTTRWTRVRRGVELTLQQAGKAMRLCGASLLQSPPQALHWLPWTSSPVL